jgi:Protein of unknown function (DUF3616)
MNRPGWARPLAQVRLDFDSVVSGEKLAHDISAVARLGDTLFIACDETSTVEVLHRTGDCSFGEHETVYLDELFALPDPGGELDIEGLAIDDGRLWIVGSHSCTRQKPEKDEPVDAKAIEGLAEIKPNANRHFLGCVPLVPLGGRRWSIGDPGAMLPVKGHRNALSKALMKDPHIAPFIGVPAKENGFDIEGIAVAGDLVAVGLRGPVVNDWGCIVSFEAKAKRKKIEVGKPLDYKKHWLKLRGLGVRDLKVDGPDLLILAGPTQALDGPVRVYRWAGWREAVAQGQDALIEPELVIELPHGDGCDHAEGLLPWPVKRGRALLVVHDSPCPSRLDDRHDVILADLFGY